MPAASTLVVILASHLRSQFADELREIAAATNHPFLTSLIGLSPVLFPTRLLSEEFNPFTARDSTTLDCWIHELQRLDVDVASHCFIVSSATTTASIQRWACSRGFPLSNLINNGVSGDGHDSINDTIQAIHCFMSRNAPASGILVVNGEALPTGKLRTPLTTNVPWQSSGFVLDAREDAIERFIALKTLTATSSTAAPCKSVNDLALIMSVESTTGDGDALVLKPHTSLAKFLQFLGPRTQLPQQVRNEHEIKGKAYARVGLMGNPSDQFNGKCMAVTVSNFWAVVTLRPNSFIQFVPNRDSDVCAFSSLRDVAATSKLNGYNGGLRLLQATCKLFFESCAAHNIRIRDDRFFSASYETNIPRQVGLAGSSCIIIAFIKALIVFYEIDYPWMELPNLALAVEQLELGIHAGLMDRVVQCFEGFVHMDFTVPTSTALGRGKYTRLPTALLPPLHLVFALDPRDSGKKHNDVKERFKKQDPAVLAAAKQWASFVDRATESLKDGDHDTFRDLFDANFNLRRSIYGNESLGVKNLRMIDIARCYGAAAKFTGSGGAILVCCRTHTDIDALRHAYDKENFVFVPLTIQETASAHPLDG